jgi:3-oxoacyl-[acyl-carrier-protein] synthase III
MGNRIGGLERGKDRSQNGDQSRLIAREGECASDLDCQAAQNLFGKGVWVATDIDYLPLCTQNPDYLLPTTACTLQPRLGLKTACGALDFNPGCSGFDYGLRLAKGLIESGQARHVLLLTAERIWEDVIWACPCWHSGLHSPARILLTSNSRRRWRLNHKPLFPCLTRYRRVPIKICANI